MSSCLVVRLSLMVIEAFISVYFSRLIFFLQLFPLSEERFLSTDFAAECTQKNALIVFRKLAKCGQSRDHRRGFVERAFRSISALAEF